MSEEKNIVEGSRPQARPDYPVGQASGDKHTHLSEEGRGPQPQTINDKPETSTMEVHKHPHVTHKKKWGEYLLEFFMLFFKIYLLDIILQKSRREINQRYSNRVSF